MRSNRDGIFNGEFRSKGSDLPISLTYTADLKIGSVKRPSEQLYFKNPYRGPMWIDEFHFRIQTSQFGVEQVALSRHLFALRMQLNAKFVVDDFVPLTLLGPHTDWTEENESSDGKFFTFFWKLAKPMWVDELDDLLLELAWIGDLNIFQPGFDPTALTVPVAVTMLGRATQNAKRPQERYLPFNAVWGPTTMAGNLAQETGRIAPDSALRNGRDVPVHVTRMLSFVQQRYSAANNAGDEIPIAPAWLNVRLSHSLGYYIVKDLTPYFELFQNRSRSFDLKFLLKPKEFLTVELQTTPIVLTGYPNPPSAFTYFFGFSVQGYSTEALR